MGEIKFPQRIKAILQNIYSGRYNTLEISELVKISRVVVTSHLSRKRKNTTYLCSKNGFSLSDLAYDCIGEVFEKSSNGEFKNLKTFFSSLNKNIHEASSVEVYLAYKSLLFRISEAQETRLFAQFDPNGFRIIRNIKESINVTPLFVLIRKNGETLLKSTNIKNNDTLPYLSIEDISNDFISLSKKDKNTVQLLGSLHKVIEAQTNCRKEILLNDAVELFKRFYGISDKFDLHSDDDGEDTNFEDRNDELEIKEIRVKVLSRIKEKILINYYAKGKVTKEQAIALYEAINDLVYDWTSLGCTSEAYFDYFKSHMEISKEEYRIHIKDKFEYLVKETKKEFAALIYSKT